MTSQHTTQAQNADRRQTVLARLRESLDQAGIKPSPRPAPQASPKAQPASAAELAQTLASSGFDVLLCANEEQLSEAVTKVTADHAVNAASVWTHPVLAKYGLADKLSAAGATVTQAGPANAGDECFCKQAATADLGVCAADAVIAETGSVIMRAGPGAPRSTSLLPPVFLAVIDPAVAVADIRALTAVLADWQANQNPSAAFCVTGPSGTGDIEFVLVRGAHGPPTVIALLVDF